MRVGRQGRHGASPRWLHRTEPGLPSVAGGGHPGRRRHLLRNRYLQPVGGALPAGLHLPGLPGGGGKGRPGGAGRYRRIISPDLLQDAELAQTDKAQK